MIELSHVVKEFPGGTRAVDDLSLEVAAGETAVLVGPSGCGKTTTLRMINRLVEPTSGRITVAGHDISGEDPVQLRRRIGYVIQQAGLFPHLSVLANTMTVPRLLGWDKRRARVRAGEMLELVGLDPAVYGNRYPHELSGGQQQRVGVARALAADPPVLLMDEPFGAVDPIARDQLQSEFLRLQAELHRTVVFVTHDIEEAIRLGDRIAVLREGGHLEQYADPATVLGQPASAFVAEFVGADRGLKRLGVTEIDRADLVHPVTLNASDSFAHGQQIMAAADRAPWAVVVDDDGGLLGWVAAASAGADAGHARVGDRVRRLPARVPITASLKQAFSVMLQHDAGWVAVLDGGRFAGVLTPDSLHAALRRSVQQGDHGHAGEHRDGGPDGGSAVAELPLPR